MSEAREPRVGLLAFARGWILLGLVLGAVVGIGRCLAALSGTPSELHLGAHTWSGPTAGWLSLGVVPLAFALAFALFALPVYGLFLLCLRLIVFLTR